MGSYSIEFKPSAEKDFSRLPQPIIVKAIERIETLATNPLPIDTKKLRGAQRLYRIRIGDYRIVYEVLSSSNRVIIHYIRHRKDVYRAL